MFKFYGCCVRLSHALSRRCRERRGASVCVTAATWSELKSGVAIPGSRAEGHRAHIQQSGCKKRHVANTGKWVTHQTHMTKTYPNGKLLLTRIFGGLISLSWCWYICLFYHANLSRTQLENAPQKLHAIWWPVLNFPLTHLSWTRLFPREWRQLGFTSPSHCNSFRGRRGRKIANSFSSFSLFPSSGSPQDEIYSLYCKCSQVKRCIQKVWAYFSTLRSAVTVLEAVLISYSLGKPKPSLLISA